MFVSVSNDNNDSNSLHKDNFILVDLLVSKFYIINSGSPFNLIYKYSTKRTELRTSSDDVEFILHHEIISTFVNKVLKFEESYILRDRDEYLVELLYFINQTIFQNSKYSIDLLNSLFFDLDLTGFLDEISATFFKMKFRVFIKNRENSTKL